MEMRMLENLCHHDEAERVLTLRDISVKTVVWNLQVIVEEWDVLTSRGSEQLNETIFSDTEWLQNQSWAENDSICKMVEWILLQLCKAHNMALFSTLPPTFRNYHLFTKCGWKYL